MKKATGTGPMKELSDIKASSDMKLKEPEQKEINEALQAINQAKITLADVYMQSAALEQRKVELMNSIAQQNTALSERVNGMAKSHGFDKDKEPKGWNLDLVSMSFQKM